MCEIRRNLILYLDEYNNFCSHGYMEDPLTATDHSAGEAQRCLDMVMKWTILNISNRNKTLAVRP